MNSKNKTQREQQIDPHCWEIARRDPVQLSLTPVLFSKAGGGILIEKPEKYGLEETTKRWIAYCF